MTLNVHIENGCESVTNLSFADAVIDFCQNSSIKLNPKVIAKVILISLESEVSTYDKI